MRRGRAGKANPPGANTEGLASVGSPMANQHKHDTESVRLDATGSQGIQHQNGPRQIGIITTDGRSPIGEPDPQ